MIIKKALKDSICINVYINVIFGKPAVIFIFMPIVYTLLLIGAAGANSFASEPFSLDSVLTVVVDKSGGGNYRTIKEAVSKSQPGQTILVKNGTYNEKIDFISSGTYKFPITLKPYKNHKPVLDFTGSPDEYPRVEINADHIVIEGFEIRGGWEGVKIYGNNNVIKENHIHSNNLSGIMIVNGSNNIIENNLIDKNGLGPDKCIYDGQSDPKKCHGIYLSNYKCRGGLDGNNIRNNHILRHPGRGIQWNGQGCKNGIERTVVEENIIENNSWGMVLYYGVYNSVIRNNSFKSKSIPETNDQNHTLVAIYGSRQNLIENNVFDTEFPQVSGLFVLDEMSSDNRVNNNSWKLSSPVWIWEGEKRRDWKDYTRVTGWGKDSSFESY